MAAFIVNSTLKMNNVHISVDEGGRAISLADGANTVLSNMMIEIDGTKDNIQAAINSNSSPNQKRNTLQLIDSKLIQKGGVGIQANDINLSIERSFLEATNRPAIGVGTTNHNSSIKNIR